MKNCIEHLFFKGPVTLFQNHVLQKFDTTDMV